MSSLSSYNKLVICSKEAAKLAKAELSNLITSWTQAQWDELDWGKVKEMTTHEILERRNHDGAKAQLGHCFECPDFVKHVSEIQVL